MNSPSKSIPLLVGVYLLGMALFLTGCITSGGTLATPNLVDDEKVVQMSEEQFEQIKKVSRLTRAPNYVNQVNRVMDQLSTQVNWWEFAADWEIIIINDNANINAFAMAGGKIGVYTGLLNLVENDDQLAFVLAHEISHVTKKHVHKKLSESMVKEAGGAVVGTAAAGTGVYTGGTYIGLGSAVSGLYNMGSGVAGLSMDRGKEREADMEGLFLMAKAGFDPNEAIRIIELVDMKAMSGGARAPSAWLSTHPTSFDRMVKVNANMPQALEYYEQAKGIALSTGGVIGI